MDIAAIGSRDWTTLWHAIHYYNCCWTKWESRAVTVSHQAKYMESSRPMLTPIQSLCTASELPVKFRSLTPFRWLETLRNHMTTMTTAVPGYWNTPQKIGFSQGWGSVYMNAYHTNEGTQIILVILDGHTLSFVPWVFTNMHIVEFPICKSI